METRVLRDRLAEETRKSTPTEPNKSVTNIVHSSTSSSINQHTENVSSQQCITADSSSNISMKQLCKALSKKLTLKQHDKNKETFSKFIELMKQFEHTGSLRSYCTFDKYVEQEVFSKRIPVSNVLIEEVTFKEFSSVYLKSNSCNNTPKLLEREEIEKRYGLKHISTCSNFRPAKQAIEISLETGNETIIGGNYHDIVFCCDLVLPNMGTKTFIILEGSSVDQSYRCNQSLHVFRIYGEDLFSKQTFLSKRLCDISIQLLN